MEKQKKIRNRIKKSIFSIIIFLVFTVQAYGFNFFILKNNKYRICSSQISKMTETGIPSFLTVSNHKINKNRQSRIPSYNEIIPVNGNKIYQLVTQSGNITNLNEEKNSFSTFKFVIISDLHLSDKQASEKLLAVIDEINNLEPQPKFVLILGDLIAEPTQFKRLMSNLKIPYYFVLGNNDYKYAKEYEKEGYSLYYTFEFSSCLFIGLWDCLPAGENDSKLNHEGDIDQEQINWLETTLEKTKIKNLPYKHIFIFAHIPINKDPKIRDNMRMRPYLSEKLISLCKEYGITACFFGHLHTNETFKIDKTEFITTGSTCWNFNNIPIGYRIVNVLENSIEHEYYPIKFLTEKISESEGKVIFGFKDESYFYSKNYPIERFF